MLPRWRFCRSGVVDTDVLRWGPGSRCPWARAKSDLRDRRSRNRSIVFACFVSSCFVSRSRLTKLAKIRTHQVAAAPISSNRWTARGGEVHDGEPTLPASSAKTSGAGHGNSSRFESAHSVAELTGAGHVHPSLHVPVLPPPTPLSPAPWPSPACAGSGRRGCAPRAPPPPCRLRRRKGAHAQSRRQPVRARNTTAVRPRPRGRARCAGRSTSGLAMLRAGLAQP